MAVSRRTARPRYTLLLLILTSLTLLTLDARGSGGGALRVVRSVARDAFAPVESAFGAVFEPIGNVIQGVVRYGDLEDENARLRRENAELRAESLKAADAEQERQALLDLQDLDFVGDIPTVPARVVNTAPSNFEETIEIDRGTAHGVAEGMPVVASGGLVGRVIEVSSSRSVVLLLIDPSASVGIRLGSGTVGVASGQAGRDDLSVAHVPPGTEVAKSDVAVTSGLQQSVFPPSIPVGTVRSVKTKPGALSLDIVLEPAVDLRRLTFVKVLQWSPSA